MVELATLWWRLILKSFQKRSNIWVSSLVNSKYIFLFIIHKKKKRKKKLIGPDIIDHAQGYLFRMQSFSADINESTSYLERAIKVRVAGRGAKVRREIVITSFFFFFLQRFNSALKSNPTNKYTLRNMAQAYYTLYSMFYPFFPLAGFPFSLIVTFMTSFVWSSLFADPILQEWNTEERNMICLQFICILISTLQIGL